MENESQPITYYNLDGDPEEAAVSFYSYDSFGRRISKATATGVGATNGNIAESYVYDGFQVIGEYATDAKYIKRRFIYAAGIDEPVAMVVEPDHQGYHGLEEFSGIAASWLYDINDTGYNSGADYNNDETVNEDDLFIFIENYYLTDRPALADPKYYGYALDALGSVVGLTYRNDPNQTGDPNEPAYFAETYIYDPFGEPTIYNQQAQAVSVSQFGNPYMFTARRYDPESGLYYYRLRMYAPELGRFLQPTQLATMTA